MKFTYRWGQRPLDAYTIKRGLGRGGFGEVYFAVSDGGKEVALKLIRGHSEIELRGIANCLNLKHPNLVHLFDLKVDAQGDRWLVMEYIHGEPLNAILNRYPHGLPEGQARQWFLQTTRAVAYLHDHAVVHRDIKPANLFIENGVVKLGDYGLSKSVGASQHNQSSNVGTIHYMAPEIASGAYSKQVDIYACGVMLYEMLTGEVPFKGESWNEIALKHQTDLPDLAKVPAAYVPILEKALNKKAERRFADMASMIRAVEDIGHSTSLPSPATAPLIPTLVTDGPSNLRMPAVPPNPKPKESPKPFSTRRYRELASSLAFAPLPAIPATAIWAIFTGSVNWSALGCLFLLMVAIAWIILIATKVWEGEKQSKPRRTLLLLGGLTIGFIGYWLQGGVFPEISTVDETVPPGLQSYWGGALRAEPGSLELLLGYLAFFGIALMLPRWWQSAERRRSERFTLYPLFAAGIWGVILLAMWRNAGGPNLPDPPGYIVLALAGAAATVQMVSPWTPPTPHTTRYRRRYQPGRAY
jgi:serine/threonine protein kinase